MRTNIYIASRWSRQLSLRQVRDQLHRKTECRVVSRWIDAERPRDPSPDFFASREGKLRMHDDLTDLRKSDMLVLDMLEGIGRRGGMMFETGYAHGLGKPIVLIGNASDCGIFGHVFIKTFPDWQTALEKYF